VELIISKSTVTYI